MKRALIISLATFIVGAAACHGQVGGNAAFAQSGGKAKAEQAERSKRVLTRHELPPSPTGMFVEASVLINMKADEYVATFGLSQDGATVDECNRTLAATVETFTEGLRALGVAAGDVYVDFVAQNKTYGFDVEGDIAREKLVGFELKKTVSIRYKDPTLLDKFVVAAARSQVHDLIRVDYVVKDAAAVQDRLVEEAARVLKRKAARYEKLLGIRLRPPAQVYAERFSTYHPQELYDTYVAAESEDVTGASHRQRYLVHGVRKGRTFYFNGLDGDGFDEVINPVVIEPVVQFTVYMKVKHEVEPVAAE